MDYYHLPVCIGLLFISFICTNTEANSNCNQVSSSTHYITDKDFIVTRSDPKYVMCAAYFCSHSPNVIPLQLTVNAINYTADNVIVHLDKKSISFRNKCGDCLNDSSDSLHKKSNKCISCPKIEPSKGVEVHVRLNNSYNSSDKADKCAWDISFNMTVQEFSCEEGSYAINMPLEDSCNVTYMTPTSLLCAKPTCYQELIFKNVTEKYIHKFVSVKHPQICIWKLDLEPHRSISITFSPSIKKYLYIFEGTLLSPKWELGTCSYVSNKTTIKLVTNVAYIVYNGAETIVRDTFLELSLEDDLHTCHLSTFIKNGQVKFLSAENGTTKAVFSCLQNYYLVGNKEIYCNSYKEQAPICVSMDKGKPVSDEPDVNQSNTSIIELDKNSIETRSADNLSVLVDTSEGSGLLYPEYRDTIVDASEVSDFESDRPELGRTFTDSGNVTHNFTLIRNRTFVHPWQSDGKLVLFSLPHLQDNLMILIIVSVGVILIVIITVISIIVCKNRSVRSGLNRKFDTFQNPIYEKPVVRVPIPRSESDPSQEKLDPGDMTDSTILD